MRSNILFYDEVGPLKYKLYELYSYDGEYSLMELPLYINDYLDEYFEYQQRRFCYRYDQMSSIDQNRYKDNCHKINEKVLVKNKKLIK